MLAGRRRPEDVQLSVGEAGILGMVVGAAWSVLNHVPSHHDPPYMVSVGNDARDEQLDFYVSGDHHTQTSRRNTVPYEVARTAMRHFLLTGQLLPEITWEEV
jgi:immunity protein Imm1 of predicted polymorphic toxin system